MHQLRLFEMLVGREIAVNKYFDFSSEGVIFASTAGKGWSLSGSFVSLSS